MWGDASCFFSCHNPRLREYFLLASPLGMVWLTRADLLVEADRFGVRRPLDLIVDVRAALNNWPEFAKQAGLNTAAANAIAADFEPL